jgi:hypothetical protein
MNLVDFAQDKSQWRTLKIAVIKILVPYNAGKFLSNYTTGDLSRRAETHLSN